MPSRFLGEIPAELTDAEEQPPARALGRLLERAPARRRAARPSPRPTAPRSALGDDVVHAKFGDGVVIGVEPGGLVVVRFAADGSERKLMADYAPLKKRG